MIFLKNDIKDLTLPIDFKKLMKSFNYEDQIEFINAIYKKYYVIPEIIKIIVIIMKCQYIQ